MRLYVDDPDNPGTRIDGLEVLRRDPHNPLPPIQVSRLLKRDRWTRHEALLILAGYSTENTVERGTVLGNPMAGIRFLDGTTKGMLDSAGLSHPLWPDPMMHDYARLADYAQGEPMDERRRPDEWIAWALSKGFRPYWLDYARAEGWSLAAPGAAAQAAQEAAPRASAQDLPPQDDVNKSRRDEAAPEPLTTEHIAAAFGRLWMDLGRASTLGNYLSHSTPQSLKGAIVSRGPRGSRSGRQWNPVKFAEWLRDKQHVEEVKLSRAFAEHDELRAWRESWRKSLDFLSQFQD